MSHKSTEGIFGYSNHMFKTRTANEEDQHAYGSIQNKCVYTIYNIYIVGIYISILFKYIYKLYIYHLDIQYIYNLSI